MIRLYDRKTTDFNNNGLRAIQPVACVVEEEINNNYQLIITMPKWDTKIQNESIIKAPTPKNGDQLFRVYDSDVDALGNNVYYAQHIFYDLRDNFLEDVRPSGNGQKALDVLLSGTQYTGESDITLSSTSYYEMMGTVEAIMGGESNNDNAFVNRWGGELERDNFAVRINQRMGKDRNVTIRYRKNLTGLTVDTDMSSVVTRIYPTGRGADGQTLLRLPEKYVDSPLIASYVHPKTRRIDYSSIQVGDGMTEDQAYNALRAAALNEYANGLDKPTVSAQVQFIPLETTEEYKDLAALEKIYIGDTVHIIHEPLEIELNMEISKYQYNCLTQRYNSIELGTPQAMIGGSDSVISEDIQSAAKEAEKAKGFAGLAQMFNNLMCNALGLYPTIQKQPDGSAIFYMHDKPKLSDSGTIYKLSASGFAVSKDGGKTFPYGFSADANIVANVIAATLIQSTTNPNVYFDLANGIISATKIVSSGDEDTYGSIGSTQEGFAGLDLYMQNILFCRLLATGKADTPPTGFSLGLNTGPIEGGGHQCFGAEEGGDSNNLTYMQFGGGNGDKAKSRVSCFEDRAQIAFFNSDGSTKSVIWCDKDGGHISPAWSGTFYTAANEPVVVQDGFIISIG